MISCLFSDIFTSGDLQKLCFAFCVVIDGVEYKTGTGINKKEARLKAATLALEEFLPSMENSSLPDTTGQTPRKLQIFVLFPFSGGSHKVTQSDFFFL